MKKAFTLIELLVVIAIIAILAAILFPVFAQAKMAAKKTSVLSNAKQTGLGILMYLPDYDDTYPQQLARTNTLGWYTNNGTVDVPGDSFDYAPYGLDNAEIHEANMSSWANAIQPYMKSFQAMHAMGENLVEYPGYTAQELQQDELKPYEWSNFAFNGLLTSYAASSVASPSKLPVLWQRHAGTSIRGSAFIGPFLDCPDPDQPCTYVPSTDDCDGGNGAYSGFLYPGVSHTWSYNKGMVYANADGSAKWRPYGQNVNGKTDFRTDPFTQYDEKGEWGGAWLDEPGCHPLLFKPDSDLTDFGNPTEWLWD